VAVGKRGVWKEIIKNRLDVVGDGVWDSVGRGSDEGEGAGWSLGAALASGLGLKVYIDALRGERVEEGSGGGRSGGVLSRGRPGRAVYLHQVSGV
jgi:hypothetical protein